MNASSAAASSVAAVDSIAFGAAASIWKQITNDLECLVRGDDPLQTPLWSDGPPDWFTAADAKTREIWAEDEHPENWAFWIKWWDAAIAGKPLNWELQRDVALIPDEVWQAGPHEVAKAIAGIELTYAIAATPNGEAVAVNPVTKRLFLVPVTDLPEDIAEYARRKIIKATELFGDTAGNQYSAIAPDLEMLRRAVADAGNLPVELFDACASASRRLGLRMRNGECPTVENDALVADYLTRIREAGADILSHDPKTQEVITARNAITGNNALIDDANTVHQAIAVIIPFTEGALATALPRDAELAVNPLADAADRKDASIRLVSRVVRLGKGAFWVAAGTGTAIIATPQVLEAIPKIIELWNSPFYQALLQAALRFAGF